jgi:hypothetical protein
MNNQCSYRGAWANKSTIRIRNIHKSECYGEIAAQPLWRIIHIYSEFYCLERFSLERAQLLSRMTGSGKSRSSLQKRPLEMLSGLIYYLA